MKFRRILRPEEVRLRLAQWFRTDDELVDPPEEGRLGPQLALGDRTPEGARVEDPRQCMLPL